MLRMNGLRVLSGLATLAMPTVANALCPGGQGCLPAISTLLTTQIPANPDASDGQPLELGVIIVPASDGAITKLRFFKAASETGSHVGRVWALDGRTLLVSATFKTETASGWQTGALAKPVPLKAGVR